MPKTLALFALTYLFTSLILLLPTPLALHAAWCYPILALVAGKTAIRFTPQRALPFALCALPLTYLLNAVRFIGETVYYMGFDTLRHMHGTMLPMMLANLRDNLDAHTIAAIILNIALVFAALYLAARLTPPKE